MRNRRALTVVLAFVAPLLLVDVAQAYYTPGLGRFINRDPYYERGENAPAASVTRIGFGISFTDGLNLYCYVANHPVGLVDPLGLKPATQCTHNGTPVAFAFDGEAFSGNGNSWEAVAGKPVSVTHTPLYKDIGGWYEVYDKRTLVFDYSKERQKKKNEGPIPEGGWWFDICEQNDASNTFGRHRYVPFGYNSWGDYDWPLHPDDGTETYGRGGFTIHGGKEWGSAGCIDLKGNDSALAAFLKDVKKEDCCCCYITVKVGYGEDKVTKTEILFSHYWSPREIP